MRVEFLKNWTRSTKDIKNIYLNWLPCLHQKLLNIDNTDAATRNLTLKMVHNDNTRPINSMPRCVHTGPHVPKRNFHVSLKNVVNGQALFLCLNFSYSKKLCKVQVSLKRARNFHHRLNPECVSLPPRFLPQTLPLLFLNLDWLRILSHRRPQKSKSQRSQSFFQKSVDAEQNLKRDSHYQKFSGSKF